MHLIHTHPQNTYIKAGSPFEASISDDMPFLIMTIGGKYECHSLLNLAVFYKTRFIQTFSFSCFSTFLYLKFLVVWALVLLADFVLEFRFEYLWPFWLFIRSVYDSFRYQGLVSGYFFILIRIS